MQEGVGYAPYGLDLSNPDFVQYAEAYGARGYRISKASAAHTPVTDIQVMIIIVISLFSCQETRCALQASCR